jgi:hypothetical protein
MDENEDSKLFLKDAGKTVEETVERVRGFEENYHHLLHRTTLALPWLANVSMAETLHKYAEEDFGAALQFARDLQETSDFQDAARLQTKYTETCLKLFWTQAKDFAPTMTSAERFRATDVS